MPLAQNFGLRATLQHIVRTAAKQHVGTRTAAQRVRAGVAVEHVGARIAGDRAVAAVAGDPVDARAAVSASAPRCPRSERPAQHGVASRGREHEVLDGVAGDDTSPRIVTRSAIVETAAISIVAADRDLRSSRRGGTADPGCRCRRRIR